MTEKPNSVCKYEDCGKPFAHGWHIVNEGLPINVHNHRFEPVAKPAEPSAEPKKKCGCVHGDSDPYCPDPLCPNYIAAYHQPAAPQPVAGEGPTSHQAYVAGVTPTDYWKLREAEGTPKLEEIARQLNEECVEYSDENGATLNIQKAVAILRPFITPACSPPRKPNKAQ